MKYEPFDEHMRLLCRQVKAKKPLAGGLIKEGTVVYALHKFRIFVPKPGSSVPPAEAMGFEMDVGLFDDYFEAIPAKV